MPAEGFKFSVIVMLCFTSMAIASLYVLSQKKVDVETLKNLYIGLGVLAALFGIPQAIQKWMDSRGQTSDDADGNKPA